MPSVWSWTTETIRRSSSIPKLARATDWTSRTTCLACFDAVGEDVDLGGPADVVGDDPGGRDVGEPAQLPLELEDLVVGALVGAGVRDRFVHLLLHGPIEPTAGSATNRGFPVPSATGGDPAGHDLGDPFPRCCQWDYCGFCCQ